MPKIYFDQAATSFPKAPGVGAAIQYYIEKLGVNIHRGTYGNAVSVEENVLETREALCRLFNFRWPENVIFTLNITYALNMLLKGILRPGDHCVVSSMEHNAVMRPLFQLQNNGVTFTRAQANSEGFLELAALEKAVQENTKVVVLSHASNVCGSIFPLEDIGNFCQSRGLYFIVDSAQTAGSLPIDMVKYHIDALAFTGHKGLLGPQGIGGFLVKKELAQEMEPLLTGGTGSLSDREEFPPYLPDKFEAGTPNIPGIFGLHAALKYLERQDIVELHEQALSLTERFLNGIKNIAGIKLIGPQTMKNRTAVVSLDFPGKDNGIIAHRLDKDYGIMARSGLHCAPSAHQTLGTFPQGTLRFSFNHLNTAEEIDYALTALQRLLQN